MSFRFAALLVALVLFAGATQAGPSPAGKAADPRAEIRAAFAKSSAASSIRITVTDLGGSGMSSVTEMQRPDRIRMVASNQPTTVAIGKTMYMQFPNRIEKQAFSGQAMAPFFDKDRARKELELGASFQLVGTENLDGEPARVYRWLPRGENTSSGKLWIGTRSGYVLQEESSMLRRGKPERSRAHFDRYDAVRIEAPKP